jgi:transposase
MDKTIMIGCDLHEKNMLLKIAVGRGKPKTRSVRNAKSDRKKLVAELHRWAAALGGVEVMLAYEASSLGFVLYDELTAAGLTCFVLSPHRIERSSKHRRTKTDEKDAQRILDLLRAYVLAGNDLPTVRVPDHQTRQDRELTRARLEAAQKAARVKTQVSSLLKRYDRVKPKTAGNNWTEAHRAWLETLIDPDRALLPGSTQIVLGSLIRQLEAIEKEIAYLNSALASLAQTPRYAEPVEALLELKGVGLLTAMVFLTELGDMRRFANRRQIGSFLGLVPSCHESGEEDDRKGHITRQGPPRVRKVLCQAVWSRVRWDEQTAHAYERLVAKNPKAKKIAVVALMRRLGIRMCRLAREAQAAAGSFEDPAQAEASK